jgi:hypothetical protein
MTSPPEHHVPNGIRPDINPQIHVAVVLLDLLGLDMPPVNWRLDCSPEGWLNGAVMYGTGGRFDREVREAMARWATLLDTRVIETPSNTQFPFTSLTVRGDYKGTTVHLWGQVDDERHKTINGEVFPS